MTPEPVVFDPRTCPTCHRAIVKDAHGGDHPSPGDHDPAYHVAAAYGTTSRRVEHGGGDYTILLGSIVAGAMTDPVQRDDSFLDAWDER